MQYMKTNRRLWKYIIFTILTFGIYGIYFISRYAKDMNIVCEGDGKKTRGFLFLFFFSILTLGIYGFVWYYCVGERIYENCAKRNIPNTTNGGKILLWDIVGSWILVGPFVAMHKIIEGLNKLCDDYNKRNNLTEGMNTGRQPDAATQTAAQPSVSVQTANQAAFQTAATASYEAVRDEGGMASVRQAQPLSSDAYQSSGSGTPAGSTQNGSLVDAGVQEAASVINDAIATAGKAAQSAQQFVQRTVSDINLGAEESLGMKWLPLVSLAAAVLFLIEFIVNFYSRPSLFSIIAALGLALLCYLKTSSIKPYAPVPFTVMSVQLLQTGLWLLANRYYYISWHYWLVLLVGILSLAGCVIHWMTLFGNLSMGKNGVFIILGAYALPAVLSLILLLMGGVSIFYCLANVAFIAAYLLLFYRSHFELLTRITGKQAVPVQTAAAKPVSAPAQHYVAPAPAISQPVPSMYERELNVPRIEVAPRSVTPPQPVPMEMPAHVMRVPQMAVPNAAPKASVTPAPASSAVVDSMIACAACGFLSPLGTTACPNCGAPIRTARRRRSAAYE